MIGGGPAGIAAACGAWRAGVREILILERQEEPGGILRQCIHHGFGLTYFQREMTGPEYAAAAHAMLPPGVRLRLGTFVTGLNRERTLTTIDDRDGLIHWRAGAVILAAGCRERPRGAINIPGTRPAGIYTAGTVQNMINLRGILPGRSAVIVGSGDIGLIMARRLVLEGVEVRGVLEISPYPGGLTRNLVQCLQDYGIPLHLGCFPAEIHGRERVSGLTAARSDGEGHPLPGGRMQITCDTILLSVGLLPEIELARQAGLAIDPRTGGPVVDGGMQTEVPGIFACGNMLHVHDLADEASREAERAGAAAAAFLAGAGRAALQLPLTLSGNLRSVVPQSLDPGRDQQLYLRVLRPQRQAVLRAGRRILARYPRVRPAEALMVQLQAGTFGPGEEPRLELEGEEDAAALFGANDSGCLVCTVCPAGCSLRAAEGGGALRIEGAGCKRGEAYARVEILAPARVLTTTVALAGGAGLLPVKSAAPIPKTKMLQAVSQLKSISMAPPIAAGEVVYPDLAGTGVPAVACRSI